MKDETVKVYPMGVPALWDSMLSGLITCKPISVGPGTSMTIEITARTNPTYRRGEVLSVGRMHVYPKDAVTHRGIVTTSIRKYKWEGE